MKKFLAALLILEIIVSVLASQHRFGSVPNIFSLAYQYANVVHWFVGGMFIVLAIFASMNTTAGREFTAFLRLLFIVLWIAVFGLAKTFENPTGIGKTGQKKAEEAIADGIGKAGDAHYRGIYISPKGKFADDVEEAIGLDIRGWEIPPLHDWWFPATMIIIILIILSWLGVGKKFPQIYLLPVVYILFAVNAKLVSAILAAIGFIWLIVKTGEGGYVVKILFLGATFFAPVLIAGYFGLDPKLTYVLVIGIIAGLYILTGLKRRS